jgi:hypothetical protein
MSELLPSHELTIDNARVADFLTASVGVFHKNGICSQKDAENFRLVINGVLSHEGSRQQSLLLSCIGQRAEFLGFIVTRYGSDRFSSNLLRYCFAPVLDETLRSLGEFGEALIEKSKLYFNRTITLYDEAQRPMRTLLFSSFLLEVCQQLIDASDNIERIQKKLLSMCRHAMAGKQDTDDPIDRQLADSLGFIRLEETSLLSLEKSVLVELSFVLNQMLSALADLMDKLSTGRRQEAESLKMELLLKDLTSLARSITEYDPHQINSVELGELKRQSLFVKFSQLNQKLSKLVTLGLGTFVPPSQGSLTPHYLGQDVKNRLIFTMMGRGILSQKAEQAGKALFDHLASQNLTPKSLLSAELTKIHPELNHNYLDVMQKIEQGNDLGLSFTEEKKLSLDKSQTFHLRFSKYLGVADKIMVLMVTFLGLFGCGLKLDPKSDIDDLRSPIPYQKDGYQRAYRPLIKEDQAIDPNLEKLPKGSEK